MGGVEMSGRFLPSLNSFCSSSTVACAPNLSQQPNTLLEGLFAFLFHVYINNRFFSSTLLILALFLFFRNRGCGGSRGAGHGLRKQIKDAIAETFSSTYGRKVVQAHPACDIINTRIVTVGLYDGPAIEAQGRTWRVV